ncbi:MAG: hypothetical protein WCN98_20860, partial [Verrucomicrobiaceae bacterium]
NLNSGNIPQVDEMEHQRAAFVTTPDYWVAQSDVDKQLAERSDCQWLMGWRNICRSTDVRTVIASIIPRVAVGHATPLLMSEVGIESQAALYSCVSSLALDYCARQKVGGLNLTYGYLKQFPIPAPDFFDTNCPWSPSVSIADWLLPCVVELTFTAWDLEAFGVDCGYAGTPFRWDEDCRSLLRAEIDAAFFHLYLGTPDEWVRDATLSLKANLTPQRGPKRCRL